MLYSPLTMKMKITYLLCLTLFIGLSSYAQELTKTSGLSISFKIKNLGATVDGFFKKGSAIVQWNEKEPTLSSIKGTADAGSITTGINLRDRHLKDKEEFFNSKVYSEVKMNAVKIEKDTKSSDSYMVTWDLTMKGITRRFKSTLKATSFNNGVELSTNFTVNRNDWGLGGKSISMGDAVTIQLKVTLSK